MLMAVEVLLYTSLPFWVMRPVTVTLLWASEPKFFTQVPIVTLNSLELVANSFGSALNWGDERGLFVDREVVWIQAEDAADQQFHIAGIHFRADQCSSIGADHHNRDLHLVTHCTATHGDRSTLVVHDHHADGTGVLCVQGLQPELTDAPVDQGDLAGDGSRVHNGFAAQRVSSGAIPHNGGKARDRIGRVVQVRVSPQFWAQENSRGPSNSGGCNTKVVTCALAAPAASKSPSSE
jgi:hypothetical protein